MTARPDADAALALLRAEFPEPWKLTLLGGGGGRWYAAAQTENWDADETPQPGGFITVDGKGYSPDAAASALIAAWRAATKPLTDLARYDALRKETERG